MPHDIDTPILFTVLVILYDMADEKRVTFRANPEKIQDLDDEIKRAQLDGRLPNDKSRSDLLRDCVDELLEELKTETESNAETEGNGTPAPAM